MRPYTTAPMFGSTRDVSEWKSQALAGFPTFSATVLTLRQRARSGEGPALKQIGQLEWSRALSNRVPHRSANALDRLIRNILASGFSSHANSRACLARLPPADGERESRSPTSVDGRTLSVGPPSSGSRRMAVPLEVNHN